ncbi:MAG: hypothetical protein ACRD0N_09715 [Acidimicrobiales bacterium]
MTLPKHERIARRLDALEAAGVIASWRAETTPAGATRWRVGGRTYDVRAVRAFIDGAHAGARARRPPKEAR